MLYPLVINWIKGSGCLELFSCLMHFELDVTITKGIRSKILFFFFSSLSRYSGYFEVSHLANTAKIPFCRWML